MSTYSDDKVKNAINYLNMASVEFNRGNYSDERYCLQRAIEKIEEAISLTFQEQRW